MWAPLARGFVRLGRYLADYQGYRAILERKWLRGAGDYPVTRKAERERRKNERGAKNAGGGLYRPRGKGTFLTIGLWKKRRGEYSLHQHA